MKIKIKRKLTQEELDSCERYANAFRTVWCKEGEEPIIPLSEYTSEEEEEIYKGRLAFVIEQHENNNKKWPFYNY